MSSVNKLLRRAIGDVNADRLKRLKSRSLIADDSHWAKAQRGIRVHPLAKAHVYDSPGSHTFFGYYDKHPESRDGKKVLAGLTTGKNAGTRSQAALNVGYFERGSNKFHLLGETLAWCWQQGAMLQWLTRGLVTYNSMWDGRPGAVVQDATSGQLEQRLSWPLYCISPNERHGLSCNFGRLHRLRRGYGYPQVIDETEDSNAPDDDGVWLIDLILNRRTLLHSVREVAAIDPHDSMKNAVHYINHLQFNPSGTRFVFIHLWISGGRQHSRMFTSSPDGMRLHLLHNHYVSHFCWRSDDELIVYSDGFDQIRRYYLYRDGHGLQKGLFTYEAFPDGHGTISPNGHHFLTDTYPDARGYQNLYILGDHARRASLAKVYHPARLANDARCDLHPRWSRDGRSVFIDAAPRGRRCLIELEISDLNLESSATPPLAMAHQA